jgi:hypothetical protein
VAKSKSEHALALLKAGISAVPYVGGPVASLIADYVPTATQKSIDLAMSLLRDRLTELESRLDVEAVNKDEFAELFKSCYLSIVRTHRESKLKAATSILVNLLLKEGDPEKLSYTELDHFSRCTENLSSGAVEVLGAVMSAANKGAHYDPLADSFRMNFSDLNAKFANLSPFLLMGLVGELDAANLLHRGNTPAIATTNYGNYPVELTPLGARFAHFLLGE